MKKVLRNQKYKCNIKKDKHEYFYKPYTEGASNLKYLILWSVIITLYPYTFVSQEFHKLFNSYLGEKSREDFMMYLYS